MDDKIHSLECLGAIEEIVTIMGDTPGGSNKRQVECQEGINRNVEAIRKHLSKYIGSEKMNSYNTNCEKHGRLIVAVLDVDTKEEKKYCLGCIEELEAKIAVAKQAIDKSVKQIEELVKSLEEAANCDDCDERMGEPIRNEGYD